MLIIQILTQPEDFFELEADWTRLWNASPRREVFTSFAWASAYVRTYERRDALRVVIARRDGHISAILPMTSADGDLVFIGTPHSDYCDLLCDDATSADELRAMLKALVDVNLPWRACRFQNVPERSRLLSICRGAKFQLGLACALRAGHPCPAVRANGDSPGVFGALLRKENPKRCEKHLKGLGALDFAHLQSRGEILACLDDFFDQHRLRRAVISRGAGMFGRAERRLFFRTLVETLAPDDALRFAVLRVAGKPVAYHFGFEIDRRYVWYVPTFDVDCWDYRPGLVLLRRLFEYAMERGLDEFDFTIGNEEYKSRFANHVEQNYELTLYPPRLQGVITRVRDGVRRCVRSGRGPARLLAKCVDVQRALRTGGLAKAAEAAGFAGSASERLAVYSLSPDPASAADAPEKARLSNLVRLWLDDRSATDPSLALERFRQGDVALVSRTAGRITSLVWVAPRYEPATRSIPSVQRPELQAGVVVYDFWTADDASPKDLPELLRRAGRTAAPDGRKAWACCPADDTTAKNVLETAGAQFAFRARATRSPNRPADSE